MLFIAVCLLFSSSRSLLNISCIFSILFPKFWILFTIFILNSFSGRLPISSSFVFVFLVGLCCESAKGPWIKRDSGLRQDGLPFRGLFVFYNLNRSLLRSPLGSQTGCWGPILKMKVPLNDFFQSPALRILRSEICALRTLSGILNSKRNMECPG